MYLNQMFLQMLLLLMWDGLFIALITAALLPLGIFRHAAFAVLKRNFIGYFSNPTGYVFLCLFVFLTAGAAFWPHEFFNANLANLDQLTKYLPLIMLVFVPAITMSIWAEEKRQGTDELLLTIPATDLDIVLGKYLAAVSVFTVSLLFSQLSNFAVLNSLAMGDLDIGLFLTTYLGYWLVGLAMLAIGMVASFLTSNLTVGFVLGAVFNLPLAIAAYSDWVVASTDIARAIARWSFSHHLADFGRGVISFSSIFFLGMLAAIGIYLSVVLIGRRHWLGGRDGHSMLGHYLARTVALLLIAIGLNIFFAHHDIFRFDASEGQVSSLSDDTVELVRNLEDDRRIKIEAFLSSSVPEEYVQTRFAMISLLSELESMSGNIDVNIYDNLDPTKDEAVRAETQYGIEPQTVMTKSRGALKQEDIFLGAAFTSGLEKVVVPFLDHGIPVEYELVRSIATVAEEERKKIGVVRTDANLMGGFEMTGMMPRNIPRQAIIDELEKQYEVEEVDPNEEIDTQAYDVLLAVQPSSLTQPQLDNLVVAVKSGMPTAIFEDPMPVAFSSAPGTSQPKRPPGGMMGMQRPPEQKGDIQELWELLGIEMVGKKSFNGFDADIIWQQYNPYKKIRQLRQITDAWVFIEPQTPGARDPLNPDSPIVSGLTRLLFLYPGAIEPDPSAPEDVQFKELVTTGDLTGTIKFSEVEAVMQTRDVRDPRSALRMRQTPTERRYVLAARIYSGEEEEEDPLAQLKKKAEELGEKVKDELGGKDAEGDSEESSSEGSGGESAANNEGSADKDPELNVVFVSDIDLMHSEFFGVRARPDPEINWRFDNVTFVLNVLDLLAGDARFLDIRKRQPAHKTLQMIEMRAAKARDDANEVIEKAQKQYENAEKEAEEKAKDAVRELNEKVEDLQQKQTEAGISQQELAELKQIMIRLAMKQRVVDEREKQTKEEIERERTRKLKEVERELDLEIVNIQNRYKMWAVLLPPIPPLLIGIVVFLRRRLREREGVSRARLR